jgi:hypothetical protein
MRFDGLLDLVKGEAEFPPRAGWSFTPELRSSGGKCRDQVPVLANLPETMTLGKEASTLGRRPRSVGVGGRGIIGPGR